jgi:acetyltransferase-like isoleucine patch superfamily enzyme
MGSPKLRKAGIVDVKFGEEVTVIEPVNLYGCTIGDGVFIGPFVEIQKGASVGHRTRVQSHSFVCDLVSIGDDCVVAHGVMFINDLFATGGPARGDRNLWKSTRIGNRVSIGSNATILPVSICDDVVIGAGAVVTKNIEKPGVYAGNPAKFIRTLPGEHS